MSCCWFPISPIGRPYTVGELASVSWWDSMEDHYVQLSHLESAGTGVAIRQSFMGGRPKFFEIPDRNFLVDRPDYFRLLVSALGQLLFQGTHLRRFVDGHALVPVPNEYFKTHCLKGAGTMARLMLIFAPSDYYEGDRTNANPECKPGVWHEVTGVGKEDTPADVRDHLLRNSAPVRDLQLEYTDRVIEFNQDPLSGEQPREIQFFEEFMWLPDATRDGGFYGLETIIMRRGLRLNVRLSREFLPWARPGGMGGDSGRFADDKEAIYVLFLQYPTGVWDPDNIARDFGAVMREAKSVPTDDQVEQTIEEYVEEEYPGRVQDTRLFINEELVEGLEGNSYPNQLLDLLWTGFRPVQEYAQPTNFYIDHVQSGDLGFPVGYDCDTQIAIVDEDDSNTLPPNPSPSIPGSPPAPIEPLQPINSSDFRIAWHDTLESPLPTVIHYSHINRQSLEQVYMGDQFGGTWRNFFDLGFRTFSPLFKRSLDYPNTPPYYSEGISPFYAQPDGSYLDRHTIYHVNVLRGTWTVGSPTGLELDNETPIRVIYSEGPGTNVSPVVENLYFYGSNQNAVYLYQSDTRDGFEGETFGIVLLKPAGESLALHTAYRWLYFRYVTLWRENDDKLYFACSTAPSVNLSSIQSSTVRIRSWGTWTHMSRLGDYFEQDGVNWITGDRLD